METVETFTDVCVETVLEQTSVPETDRANDDDLIEVKLSFCVASLDRHGLDGPYEQRSSEILYTIPCRVFLGLIKKKRSRYRSYCRSKFAAKISSQENLINIPNKAHSKALRLLFKALDRAVNSQLSIKLQIWDLTVRTWEFESCINFVCATRDSIEGLERLRLQVVGGEQCAICLEDYDQPAVVVTRLPCSHYFHTDCTALWLHTHQTCPLCRFALPTTPQQP